MERNDDPNWYRTRYTTQIIGAPWTEHTREEVDLLMRGLMIRGGERVLDFGCGFGRHSLEIARRGCQVVGVDLSADLIRLAGEAAVREALPATFLCSDIRDVPFEAEFDIALNLYLGGIGFFETEEENQRVFHAIARSLRSGGKSLVHVTNIDYVRRHFPGVWWERGEHMVELWEYDWDEARRRLYETSYQIQYGRRFDGLTPSAYHVRVYEPDELVASLETAGLRVLGVHHDDTVMKSYNGYYTTVLSEKVE